MRQRHPWAMWAAALGIRGGLSGVLTLLAAVAALGQDVRPRPNIVFCITDDQGYGDVGYMGHPVLQTPVLDEMAASGLRFDRFYSASPVCSPTRASVLTGRHPSRAGVFRWGNALRPQERTLATLIGQAGYRTGFFGKWHLGSVRADRPTNPAAHGFDFWCAAPNYFLNNPWMSVQGKPVQLQGEGSMVTVERSLEFIRGAAGDKQPFMAFICFGAPHTPHRATKALRALYPDQPNQLRNYYGEITGIDRAMGRLRDELRELGIAGNTLLVFTSDNGGRPQDGSDLKNLRGHKGQLWEGGIRVPALMVWPGRIEPRVTAVPAGSVDFFPTFLELAGVTVPGDRPLDGISLVPLIDGQVDARPQPLAFWDYPKPETMAMRSDEIVQQLQAVLAAGGEGEIPEGRLHGPDQPYEELDDYPGHSVWMEGAWKLHRTPEHKFLLYNLESDPAERHNVIAEHAERTERMKQQLRAWEETVIHSVRGGDY